jgi:hypothetical protein
MARSIGSSCSFIRTRQLDVGTSINTATRSKGSSVRDSQETSADFHDLGAKSDEFNKTPWFHFNIGVKALFENWLATNEDKVADKHEPILIRQHLSKYPDLLCALG